MTEQDSEDEFPDYPINDEERRAVARASAFARNQRLADAIGEDYDPDDEDEEGEEAVDDEAYEDEVIGDPGDYDGGFGPGSYYERAMSKDD